MYRYSPTLSILTVVLLLWMPTPSHAGSFDNSRITSGTDNAELAKEPRDKGTFNKLVGSYNNTTFSISIGRFDLPGMAYFPEGIHYGASSRYVWISSYYRYFSGVTLVDVVTGKSIFAGHGRGATLSPDDKRIVYVVDGIYGPLIAVAVNDFIVYPRIQQSAEMITRGNADVEKAAHGTPMMDPESILSWLDNSTVCFVCSENGRAADVENNPAIKKYYMVEVTGVGDNMSTNTIVVKRAELNGEQSQNLENDTKWDIEQLRSQLADKLAPVTDDIWEPDIFDHNPKWPMFPVAHKLGDVQWDSPDHKHSIKAGFDKVYTDSYSGISIHFDDVMLVTIKTHEESMGRNESPNPQTTMSKQFITVGPTSRLLSPPHWLSNDKAEVVMQSNWAGEAVLGDQSKTKFWLVTIGLMDSDPIPVAEKKEITRETANELAKKFKAGSTP